MPVETAADRAIFVDADEFGAAVKWTSVAAVANFSAIFDAEYQLLTLPDLDAGVEASGPQIQCRTSDLPADAAHQDSVQVTDPETSALSNFVVVEIKPDGTGMTVVRLQEA
ncbi:hypothetical protein [Mesorhizobium sp. B2-5-3]|uniref:head-tail joining protein n=1 Tax=Mesorhizobium sp. B2-5-3 TaxID=2589927 RepID=UPI001128F3F4|nr:hypothetical protein [Mesorhizobium sp. B2-5-3]TPK38698.1 hypothetical protein FJ867_08825 [Mesorhizobium sp. B2-5-3]